MWSNRPYNMMLYLVRGLSNVKMNRAMGSSVEQPLRIFTDENTIDVGRRTFYTVPNVLKVVWLLNYERRGRRGQYMMTTPLCGSTFLCCGSLPGTAAVRVAPAHNNFTETIGTPFFRTTMMNTAENGNPENSFAQKGIEEINDVLASPTLGIDESKQLLNLFRKLQEEPTTETTTGNDRKGQQLLTRVLKKNPPVEVIEALLGAYPDAVCFNPIAFFAACENNVSRKALVPMMKQLVKKTENDDCPFPWIMSKHITLQGAKVLIEMYPEGVLKKSQILSGYNVLDYVLRSDDMVEQPIFDAILWNKFKLILRAAQYCTGELVMAPIQMFLRRVLTHEELFTNPTKAQHMLWLLSQFNYGEFTKQNMDGKYPLHFLITQMCKVPDSGLPVAREIIRILIEAYPASVKHNLDGTPTLHLAITNRWPCHDLLLAVHPDALEIQDPITGLYPFQMAATAATAIPDIEEEEIIQSSPLWIAEESRTMEPMEEISRVDDEEEQIEEDTSVGRLEEVFGIDCQNFITNPKVPKPKYDNCFDTIYLLLREKPDVICYHMV